MRILEFLRESRVQIVPLTMQSLQIENACGQDSIRTKFHSNIIEVSKCPLAPIFSAFVHMNYLHNSVGPQLSNFNSHYNDKNG